MNARANDNEHPATVDYARLLAEAPPQELRAVLSIAAGLLAHREGDKAAAVTVGNIRTALIKEGLDT